MNSNLSRLPAAPRLLAGIGDSSYSRSPKQGSKIPISSTSTPVNHSTPSWQQVQGCSSPKSTSSYTLTSTLPEQMNHILLKPYKAIKCSRRRCHSSNTPMPSKTNPAGAVRLGKYKAGSHHGVLFGSYSASCARAVGSQPARWRGRQGTDLSIVSLRRLGVILGTNNCWCWSLRCKGDERMSFIINLSQYQRTHKLI